MKLSFKSRRVLAAAALMLILICITNVIFDLGMFGRFARQALVISVVVGYLELLIVGPSIEELRAYRRRRDQVT